MSFALGEPDRHRSASRARGTGGDWGTAWGAVSGDRHGSETSDCMVCGVVCFGVGCYEYSIVDCSVSPLTKPALYMHN